MGADRQDLVQRRARSGSTPSLSLALPRRPDAASGREGAPHPCCRITHPSAQAMAGAPVLFSIAVARLGSCSSTHRCARPAASAPGFPPCRRRADSGSALLRCNVGRRAAAVTTVLFGTVAAAGRQGARPCQDIGGFGAEQLQPCQALRSKALQQGRNPALRLASAATVSNLALNSAAASASTASSGRTPQRKQSASQGIMVATHTVVIT